MKKRDTTRLIDALVQRYGATTISLVLDAFKELGFKYATQAGITISKNDVVVPPSKQRDPRALRGGGRGDPGAVRHRLDHAGGAPRSVVERWNACTDEVAEAMIENLDELNPIFMMANSEPAARSSRSASSPVCAA